jgi:hypothetical protein
VDTLIVELYYFNTFATLATHYTPPSSQAIPLLIYIQLMGPSGYDWRAGTSSKGYIVVNGKRRARRIRSI